MTKKKNTCEQAQEEFFRATKNVRLSVFLRNNRIVGKCSGRLRMSKKFGRSWCVSVLWSMPQYHGGYTTTSDTLLAGVKKCFVGLKDDLNKIGFDLQEENILSDLPLELRRNGVEIIEVRA